MHLVFLNQYYPPDAAPTGVMLEAVAEECARAGHHVTVICAEGGYAGGGKGSGSRGAAEESVATFPNGIENLAVIRIGATKFGRGSFIGKLLDYVSYYLGVMWRLWRMSPQPERIVALTTPPYLSLLARGMSKVRGADHAHWVMDLYPDVMTAHGMLRESGVIYQVLAVLARWGLGGRRCAAVLTLGPDMAERVTRQMAGDGQREALVSWVPLWGTETSGPGRIPAGGDDAMDVSGARVEVDEAQMLRRERGWADDDLVVMYSGNMGLGHRFGEILEVANRQMEMAGPGRVRFVFFGGGKRRGEIEQAARDHPESGVEVHDYAPAARLVAHLQSADVHLASLNESWTGTMVPSKLQGIFAVGRPVVFIGSAGSSIGRWVRESDGGWVVEPGDVEGLRGALLQAQDVGVRRAKGAAAKAFAELHFTKTTNVSRVVEVLVERRDIVNIR